MTDGNKALMRRWYEEVWNQQRAETIDELLHPGALAHGFPDASGSITSEQFKAVHRAFLDTFENVHIRVDEVLAEGDCAAARFTCSMTRNGAPITLTGSAFCRWKNGQIVEGWNFMDTTVLAAHLPPIA